MAIDLPPPGPGTNKNNPKDFKPAEGTKDNYKGSSLEEMNEKRKKDAAKRREDEKVLREAVRRYKRAQEAEADNRGAALEDLKFKAGDQWPADIKAERAQQKRPCITINGLPTFTHQIANDIRQNRQGINLSPVGDESTKQAAELVTSVIRGIERDSAADIAYDTAVGSAIDIGFGYWRYTTEYESPDTFNQVVVIRRVRNTFTILLDNNRQEPDGSDSKWGFVSELIDREDFKREWPNAREVPWRERGLGEEYKEWSTKDQIRIAEYFTLEYEKRRLVALNNGHTGWYDELDEKVKADIAKGMIEIVHDRESESPKVTWYKITSAEILEQTPWPGKWIPIVEVIGDEIDIEGKVIKSGVIRNAKDPMRMKNYWATSATEVVALAPKTPYILAEGQDEGYEDEWKMANTKPLPVLHYVPVRAENGQVLPPPQRTPAPQVPQGMVEREKQAEQDLMRTTGVRFDATVSERMYDESGKAIKELRRTGDIGSFHYSDNFSRSLRHGGRILLDLLPKVYDSERYVTGVGEDGSDSRIKLDPSMRTSVGRLPNPFNQGQPQGQGPGQDGKQNPFMLPQMPDFSKSREEQLRQMTSQQQQQPAPVMSQEQLKVLNLKKGQFAVTVTTGPSYATRRIEAQEQMSQVIAKVPENMRGVVAALMAKYSDWPGSTELYKALTKMLPPNVLMPDMQDLPPAVAAFVGSLTQQVRALMTERMQLLRDLTDKKTDQMIAKDKVERDFEAKLMKIVSEMTRDWVGMQKEMVNNLNQLAGVVKDVEKQLTAGNAMNGNAILQLMGQGGGKPPMPGGNGAQPPAPGTPPPGGLPPGGGGMPPMPGGGGLPQ